MKLQEWRDQGKFFQFKNHRIFYQDSGEGTPLLLIHAYPTASWGFHKLWPSLIQHFRVIAPDLLGSGFSDKPREGSYAISLLADLVQELLQSLGIRETHLLAHAYGVTTAQELLARQVDQQLPFQILSACFINGGLFPEATHLAPIQKFLLTPLGASIAPLVPTPYSVFCKQLTRTFGPNTTPTEAEFQEFWQLLRFNEGQRVVPQVLTYLKEREVQRDRWVGALLHARIPLCLINGAADPVSGRDIPKRWQELLPQSPVVQLDPQIGHYPPFEDPEEVLKAYQDFIFQT